jgi:hypothetical protein
MIPVGKTSTLFFLANHTLKTPKREAIISRIDI